MKRSSSAGRLAAMMAGCALGVLTSAVALASPGAVVDFDIEAQPLATALIEFGRQSSSEIAFSRADLEGQMAPPVRGSYEPSQALALLLDAANVNARTTERGVTVIEPAPHHPAATQGQSSAGSTQNRAQPSGGGGGMANASGRGSSAALEVIYVTARKREEDLRRVAGSVTALTGRQLDELGAQSFADYLTRLPGVQFNDAMPGYSSISIRGVSSTTSIDVGQGTTGVYINEVPLTEPFNSAGIPDIDAFDMERVEVLRGPQGTLFGSATLGGAVNYVAARADHSGFDGRVETSLSSTSSAGSPNYTGKAMVNVPVIEDRLAIRAVGTYRRNAGYLDNVGVGQTDTNGIDSYGGRISVEWQASEAISVSALSLFFRSETEDSFSAFPGLGDLTRSSSLLEPFRATTEVHSLRSDIDLGSATLVLHAARMDKSTHNIADFTANFGGLFANIPTQVPLVAERQSSGDLFEARLMSPSGGTFEWLVGASYNRTRIDMPSYAEFDGAAALIEQIYGPAFGAGVGALAAPGDRFTDYMLRVNGEEAAVFGEANWRFAPNWTLTAGGRYFDTSINHRSRMTGLLTLLSSGDPVSEPDPASAGETGFNPKISLTYEFSDNLMAYALASRGFRFGGPNPIPPNPNFPSPESFGSDTLYNYEIGVRASSPDRSWLFDATVFYIDWDDIQLQVVRGDNLAFADNVGAARNYGVDVSATWQPLAQLSLTTMVGYLDATLRNEVVSGGTTVEPGARMPGASRWRISNAVTWTGDGALEPMAMLTHRYVSGAPSNLAGTLEQGDYHVLDARGSFRVQGARIEGFVENIADSRGVTVSQLGGGILRQHHVRPRTAGVRFTYDF
ncbi:TonB-dependent receptor [Glycocaulis sp.]|uniref:TonB-dependent receptor n=1 Tax=Glycocaulis sp. TaxID=1969725 RepID=UPI003D1A3812